MKSGTPNQAVRRAGARRFAQDECGRHRHLIAASSLWQGHTGSDRSAPRGFTTAPNYWCSLGEMQAKVNMSHKAFMIRITSVPPGEAPLWVREKWLGLELPIYGLALPRIYNTVGVVTGPSSRLGYLFAVLRRRSKTSGYLVDGEARAHCSCGSESRSSRLVARQCTKFPSGNRCLVFCDSARQP